MYPLSVNYTSRSTSARNIAIKVQFLAGEEMSPVEVRPGNQIDSRLVFMNFSKKAIHRIYPDGILSTLTPNIFRPFSF